jgi:ribosome-associated translation inhibitor RaiA
MQIPLNLTTRRVELPPALDDLIRRKVEKLERFSDRLIRCDVVVEGPGERHESGGPYDVRLDISVPGSELVVTKRTRPVGRGDVAGTACDVGAGLDGRVRVRGVA